MYGGGGGDSGYRHYRGGGWNGGYYGGVGGFYPEVEYSDTYVDSVPEEEVEVTPQPAPRVAAAPDGDLAAEVQSALAKRGYHPGPVDGELGAQTRNAITEFQTEHGFEPTGHLNARLLSALGIH